MTQEEKDRQEILYEEYKNKIDSNYEKEDVGIYLFRNLETNKIYIGQSKKLAERKKKFLSFNGEYGGTKINEARRSYPNEKYWEYTILEYCKPSELNTKETYYIDKYKSYEDEIGYNKYIEETLEFQLQSVLSSVRYGKVRDYDERRKIKEIHDCQAELIRKRLEPFRKARDILMDKVAISKLNDFETFLRDIQLKIETLKSEGICNTQWRDLMRHVKLNMDKIDNQYDDPIRNRKFGLDELKEIIGDDQ